MLYRLASLSFSDAVFRQDFNNVVQLCEILLRLVLYVFPVCLLYALAPCGLQIVRIDPLRFLAGCRTRRLNQV